MMTFLLSIFEQIFKWGNKRFPISASFEVGKALYITTNIQ